MQTAPPPPPIKVAIKITKEFQTPRITLTRLKFHCEALSHAAYIIHNFEPMICELSVKVEGLDRFDSIEKFYLYLSQLGTWNDSNEFTYIPKVRELIFNRKNSNKNETL